MLSFTLANEGRAIRICCDEEGLATLVRAIDKLRADGDHLHLRTRPSASRGLALSDKDPWGNKAIPEVVVDWVEDDD